MALFMGLSRTHICTRNGEHTWLNTDTWVALTIYVYRGKSFMLPRDKVHPEPFSKIGHDGAGHGYLGTSTINVEYLSIAILSLCNLFDSQDAFIY